MCTLNIHPRGLNFQSVLLYDQPFSRYRFFENRKCTEWPQNDLTHLSVKSTLYTLNTHPEAQISIRFALRQAIFEILACGKSECTEWPQNDLNHWSVISTLCTLNTRPEAQISFRFALRSFVFQIIEFCFFFFGFPIGYYGEIKKNR